VGAGRLTAGLAAAVVLVTAGCVDRTTSVEPPSAGTGVVARVNDGDTLTLEGGAKVRLVQVDAPELTSDCYGRAARDVLSSLAHPGSRVRFVRDPALDDRDTYGRLLRYVVAGDTDVNVELVRRGAASPYFFRNERGMHAGELLDAVDEARDAGRGYWGACPGARLDTGLGAITGRAS
jgi:endonuclease YncB( thermonuclease family)